MTIDWSSKKARRRTPEARLKDAEDASLPELPASRKPTKLSKSRKQQEKEAWEELVSQQLVHDWLIFQCRFDPELRHIYELYIGPVPGSSYGSGGLNQTEW